MRQAESSYQGQMLLLRALEGLVLQAVDSTTGVRLRFASSEDSPHYYLNLYSTFYLQIDGKSKYNTDLSINEIAELLESRFMGQPVVEVDRMEIWRIRLRFPNELSIGLNLLSEDAILLETPDAQFVIGQQFHSSLHRWPFHEEEYLSMLHAEEPLALQQQRQDDQLFALRHQPCWGFDANRWSGAYLSLSLGDHLPASEERDEVSQFALVVTGRWELVAKKTIVAHHTMATEVVNREVEPRLRGSVCKRIKRISAFHFILAFSGEIWLHIYLTDYLYIIDREKETSFRIGGDFHPIVRKLGLNS